MVISSSKLLSHGLSGEPLTKLSSTLIYRPCLDPIPNRNENFIKIKLPLCLFDFIVIWRYISNNILQFNR